MFDIELVLQSIRRSKSSTQALCDIAKRIETLTMPTRAMGRSLELVEELTRAAGRLPLCEKPSLLLFVGEHGVTEEGVSAYPSEVTGQMLLNFLSGGAAINQLAKSVGAGLKVVNIATKGDFPKHPNFQNTPVADQSANLVKGPSLEYQKMIRAIEIGYESSMQEIEKGVDLIGCGEMGIGNTTSSACLTVAFTNCATDEAVGRGTGIDDMGLKRKQEIVEKALKRIPDIAKSPLNYLQEWGGYEHAGIVGVVLACAEKRVPFLMDGFNVTTAAVVAAVLEERCREIMIAAHQGEEPGHKILLKFLDKKAYLNWSLRLGEGSGAALLVPLCRASCHMVAHMSTFESANVSDKL